MRKAVCIRCNKYIKLGAEICPYCGMNQFDEEFLAEQAKEDAKKLLKTLKKKNKNSTQNGFTDEEILALGLYPEDEGYKMSLISKILGKNRQYSHIWDGNNVLLLLCFYIF